MTSQKKSLKSIKKKLSVRPSTYKSRRSKSDVVPSLLKLTSGNPLDLSRDQFAYLVARGAWEYGFSANKIVQEMGLEPAPQHLMKVKRALARAYGKYLFLQPPVSQRLAEDLSLHINSGRDIKIKFHVVDDTHVLGRDAICSLAAQVAMDIIEEIITKHSAKVDSSTTDAQQDSPDNTCRMIICNAGGQSVAGIVQEMARNPEALAAITGDDPINHQLHFVAGNSAYLHDQFDQSAKFLAVTMAKLFDASHEVLPEVLTEDYKEKHKQYLLDAKLFICGVGSCGPGAQAGLMKRHLDAKGFKVPKSAVGDLSFCLLDKNGLEVPLKDKQAQSYMEEVNPTLTAQVLTQIRDHNRVLLILSSDQPFTKEQIALAALRGGYPTDVVVGARLARRILKRY